MLMFVIEKLWLYKFIGFCEGINEGPLGYKAKICFEKGRVKVDQMLEKNL